MRAHPHRGFTLLELIIAMMLLALISSLLYGTLSLSARSWDSGEAKAQQASDMRLAENFLRQSLTAQHPLRMHKALEQPLYFKGASDALAYAAVLPARAGGGIYYFRVAVTRAGDTPKLTLARVVPESAATTLPGFDDSELSVLAGNISEVHFSYFGRDADSNIAVAPSWRDEWRDPNLLPLMIRIDVTPQKGAPWPSLLVEPRLAPEVGCAAWDFNRSRCVGT